METLFDYRRPFAGVLELQREGLRKAVEAESESYIRDVDPDEYAAHLAEQFALKPPCLSVDEPELEDLGEVQVNATNMPGVTYSLSEWGQVIRPGRRLRLAVEVEGGAGLLRHGPSGGFPVLEGGEIEGARVVRIWDWPTVKGPGELDAEVQQFFGTLRDGTARLAAEVVQFNESMPAHARKVIDERRAAVEAQQGFLGGLKVPVRRREDAPRTFSIPPLTRRASRAAERAPAKPQPLSAPALGEFYDEILGIVHGTGTAMERTPGAAAEMGEEQLRDHLLWVLNSHYQGQAHAEAFNRSGRTDILIRVDNENLFIGECKWWRGPKRMDEALDQLYGYSTWRDSRLALIFFVRQVDAQAIFDKARAQLEDRPEFSGWEKSAREKELRCRIEWPDDPGRRAVLTVMLFHLPAKAGEGEQGQMPAADAPPAS